MPITLKNICASKAALNIIKQDLKCQLRLKMFTPKRLLEYKKVRFKIAVAFKNVCASKIPIFLSYKTKLDLKWQFLVFRTRFCAHTIFLNYISSAFENTSEKTPSIMSSKF